MDMTQLLVARLQHLLTETDNDRRLCVLLGAGATVPYVAGVTTLTQNALLFADGRGASGAAAGLRAIGAGGGIQDERINQYSDALELIQRARGPEGVRAFIQRSVLQAYAGNVPATVTERPLSDSEFEILEANAPSWRVPDGLLALAEVIKERGNRFCPYLLTTNFDPLLEIALRLAGMVARTLAVHHDTTPVGMRLAANDRLVIHLHGDCRGPTLHSPAAFGLARPALEAWLGRHLQNTTLLVVGYSGWDDIIRRVMRYELDERSSGDSDTAPDIAWAIYEDESTHGHINPKLARFFHDNSPRVTPYFNVDRDRLFVELHDALRSTSDSGPTSRSQQPSSAFYTLVKRLNVEFHFGHSPIPQRMAPMFAFWPHRLRNPHLIHGVHALAAVLFSRLNIPVELHLDDSGMATTHSDPLAAQFEEAVRAWFTTCGAPTMPTIRRTSQLLAARDNSGARLWNLATQLFSPTISTFDALVATRMVEPEIDTLRASSAPSSRMLRPLYTWFALEDALERHGVSGLQSAPVVTLGGQDTQKIWDLWRGRPGVASVASVYVPRLESPAEGVDLWKYQELKRDAPFRERDLGRFIRSAQADASGSEPLLEWLYTAGVRLAVLASGGTIGKLATRDGRQLDSWFDALAALRADPVGVSRDVARAISAWFHAES